MTVDAETRDERRGRVTLRLAAGERERRSGENAESEGNGGKSKFRKSFSSLHRPRTLDRCRTGVPVGSRTARGRRLNLLSASNLSGLHTVESQSSDPFTEANYILLLKTCIYCTVRGAALHICFHMSRRRSAERGDSEVPKAHQSSRRGKPRSQPPRDRTLYRSVQHSTSSEGSANDPD